MLKCVYLTTKILQVRSVFALPPVYRSTFILRPGCNNSFAFAFVLDVAMHSLAACLLCGLDVAVAPQLVWQQQCVVSIGLAVVRHFWRQRTGCGCMTVQLNAIRSTCMLAAMSPNQNRKRVHISPP